MKVLEFILALAQQAGDKLPKMWPHIVHMYADMLEILKVFNDGTLPTFAAGDQVATTNTSAAKFVALAESNGIDRAEAEKIAAAAYALDQRLI